MSEHIKYRGILRMSYERLKKELNLHEEVEIRAIQVDHSLEVVEIIIGSDQPVYVNDEPYTFAIEEGQRIPVSFSGFENF